MSLAMYILKKIHEEELSDFAYLDNFKSFAINLKGKKHKEDDEPCFLLFNLSRMPAHVGLSILSGSVGYSRGTHSYQTSLSRLSLVQLRIG